MKNRAALFVWMYLLATILLEFVFSNVLDTSRQVLAIGSVVASQLLVISLFYMEVRSGGRFLKYIPITALALVVVLTVALVVSYGHG
jgi:amino acid transporter